ncbi:MAG: hypothetical protein U0228_14340 [Myxococcaceae bacterium]
MSSLVILALLAASPDADQERHCDDEDAHGHRFATCFDPWLGLELGGAVQLGGVATPGVTGVGEAAFRLRGQRESDSKADSTWFALHRLGASTLRGVDGKLDVQVLGYQLLLRRHVREGVLLLPFTPPVSIPFPLDLGVMIDLARWQRRLSEGSDWSFEPVRLSLLFDPLRSKSNRFHLAFGATAAWKLRQVSGVVLHEVTPLTAATVFFDFESEDGLWLARGTLSGGWAFVAPDTRLSLRARGEVELARVVLAIADQPLSLYVKGTGAWRDAGAREGSEWSAEAGLQIRLFSAR